MRIINSLLQYAKIDFDILSLPLLIIMLLDEI